MPQLTRGHSGALRLIETESAGALRSTQTHRDRKQNSGLPGWGAGEARLGLKIQLCKMKRVLPTDGCNDSTATWMDFMTLNVSELYA